MVLVTLRNPNKHIIESFTVLTKDDNIIIKARENGFTETIGIFDISEFKLPKIRLERI